eukprot:CAMPEP_0114258924 /NCGR_PEP_ID=MMETSP0058-20121206/19605_1 /TAXON_ID=36894 /ORGANISM="Pyramimonas parkeae, CCMP726" /LENGTH=454 /DNA_ID=CAMNT_0001373909 /DNA_START=294 /DNA_END=1658 /DNA_ORIENTATION=+
MPPRPSAQVLEQVSAAPTNHKPVATPRSANHGPETKRPSSRVEASTNPKPSPPVPQVDAEAGLGRAQELLKQQMFPEAQTLLQQLLFVIPHHPFVHFFMGACHQQFNRNEEAVSSYMSALSLNPTLIYARVNMIEVLCSMGKLKEALKHGEDAIFHEPNNADRHYLVGVIQRDLGKHTEAAQAFTRAIKHNPCFREAYINNDAQLLKLDSLKACRKMADMAVAETKAGRMKFWTNPLQRPPAFVTDLTAEPWWDKNKFPWVQKLEAAYPLILAELKIMMGSSEDSELTLVPSSWGNVGSRSVHDASLLKAGQWKEFPLFGGLGPIVENCRKCPKTTDILLSVPEILNMSQTGMGETLFSVISPGTHLRPHCGSTNARLTCHLGIIVPEGCKIRAGDKWGTWENGKCIVFDDSFEHEVRHDGDSSRVVLLINFWHPEFPKDKWGPIQSDNKYQVA